ncbi:MAG: hypothetical protein AAF921_14060 [Cyanobacteria bacterium P01_D01_bin.44]
MEIVNQNRADLMAKQDFSDAIAQIECGFLEAGLTWRSPLVVGWVQSMGCPNRHWLGGDDFEELVERVAIAIVDGGVHA